MDYYWVVWSEPSTASLSRFEGIPAFIVTLATLAVVRGIALLVTQGYSIPVPADSLFTFMGRALGAWAFPCLR